jgi:hypothetical protein
MARRRVEATEALQDGETNAQRLVQVMTDERGIKYTKCECNLEVSVGTLAQNGGRCVGCGRGVHLALPEQAKPSQYEIDKANQDAARAAMIPPPSPTVREPKGEVITTALGAAFFGNFEPTKVPISVPNFDSTPPLALPATNKRYRDSIEESEVLNGLEENQEVTASWPEEMYGKTGTFCSYRVGPFTAKSRIRAGETRPMAFKRVMDELADVAKLERIRARDAFLEHLPGAFSK